MTSLLSGMKEARRLKLRCVEPARKRPDGEEDCCECCQISLAGKKIAWLERDLRSGTFHDLGGVPREESQGWFPFGLTCAHKKLENHYLAIAEQEAREAVRG